LELERNTKTKRKRNVLFLMISLFVALWMPFVFFSIRLLLERTIEMEMTVAIVFGITLQITLVLLFLLGIIYFIARIMKKRRNDPVRNKER